MSETVTIRAPSGRSQILLGEPIETLTDLLGGPPAAVVTDRTVLRLFGHRFPKTSLVVSVGKGERNKSLRTAAHLYGRLLDAGLDRSDWIVGVGGGIVCDITGFVASTFLRGVPFAFAPTTLLAQADAAVGGKNGLNVRGYKNMIGLVRQPRYVLCDPSVLTTLPPLERRCGFAEIIKAAAVADSRLFDFLEAHAAVLRRLEPVSTVQAVAAAVKAKASFVSRDDEDCGERRKLNFGHTLGHALEKTARLPHGLAVSIGMALAARLSVRRGLLARDEGRRLERLLRAFRLPTRPPRRMKARRLLEAVSHDKKKKGETIDFILLQSLGRSVIAPLRPAELKEDLRDLR